MSGGGSGGSTTVQKADPWSGVQPYLSQLYSSAGNLAKQGGPQVAQNSGVAPFTPYTSSIMGLMNTFGSQGGANGNAFANDAQQYAGMGSTPNQYLLNFIRGDDQSQKTMAAGMQGNDATGQYYKSVLNGSSAPTQYLNQVLGGAYLNPSTNPNLTGAVNAASADATRNFQTAVMPQLASQFSLAGRYGSGAQSQGVSDATNNLAEQLSNTAAGIYNQNYQNERGIQNGAAGTLAGLQSGAAGSLGAYTQGAAGQYLSSLMGANQALSANQLAGGQMLNQANSNDVNRLNMLGTVSDAMQGQAQNTLAGQNALFNANQQQPYQNMNWLNGILNGSMSLNGQTSSTTGNSSTLQRLGGGALSGGMLGGALAGASGGAIAGPVGAGVGALGGALLSVL